MTEVTFSSQGPPDVVLPAPEPEAAHALEAALADPRPRHAVAEVLASRPTFLDAWADAGELAEHGADDLRGSVEAYAYFRVGYHRGLDALRANGWKGSGFVRWAEPTNRGFLRCLDGLRRMAEALEETAEADRCASFLRQLDPGWVADH